MQAQASGEVDVTSFALTRVAETVGTALVEKLRPRLMMMERPVCRRAGRGRRRGTRKPATSISRNSQNARLAVGVKTQILGPGLCRVRPIVSAVVEDGAAALRPDVATVEGEANPQRPFAGLGPEVTSWRRRGRIGV